MNGGNSILTTRKIALQVKGIIPSPVTVLHLHVDEHVGGCPYRQTYRIRPVNNDAAFVGLIPTAVYCLKVYHVSLCRFCPPDSFLYTTLPRRGLVKNLNRVGRLGALWQILVRTAVAHELNMPEAVPKIFATFYDQNLLAFGTIEEWVAGRSWRLEIDDRIFDRVAPPDPPDLFEPSSFPDEYTAKRFFLARFEHVLEKMGAEGLAMRYAWRNLLSTRRVVLRAGGTDPYKDLVALDFEPALGDVSQLEAYLEHHAEWFALVHGAAQELLTLLREISAGTTCSSIMPRSNPGVAQLLWYWSSRHPSVRGIRRWTRMWQHITRQIHITVRLAKDQLLREAWLLEQVERGEEEGQLSDEEAARIREQAASPDIQVYLHCLFVHLCMLPITPAVVLIGGALETLIGHTSVWVGMRTVATWLAIFAIAPISPGSVARGLYVAWMAMKRKLLRRLRVALFVSFWRYVSLLAFPLQMATTFPALSRYMAALWATRTVRYIPYYGKPGGRLEHAVFDLFFNLPLSWARRRRERRTAPSEPLADSKPVATKGD